MKFIEINDYQTINTKAISRIEKLEMGRTMVIMKDESLIADIPYETMIGILQNESEIESGGKEQVFTNMANSLNTLTQNSQFTRL